VEQEMFERLFPDGLLFTRDNCRLAAKSGLNIVGFGFRWLKYLLGSKKAEKFYTDTSTDWNLYYNYKKLTYEQYQYRAVQLLYRIWKSEFSS
jgi:hypothetical protein